MADTKISALTAVGSVVAAQEFAVNDAGVSKKATAAQVAAFMTRLRLPADAKGWQFLGQGAASAAVRTSTVTWTGTYAQLWVEYYITGYSNTTVGRVIPGLAAGPLETTGNCCTSIIEGVTLNVTSVSAAGWPTSVTIDQVPRYGHMWIENRGTDVKRMSGHGQSAGTAPTTCPRQYRAEGLANITAGPIQSMKLCTYDLLTGSTVSTRTFNAGTVINCWGRNDD